MAVYEDAGFRAALDCDAIVSCVDRPWGRYVLTLLPIHLIPVIDGGIAVRVNRRGELVKADWRAHTATVGRYVSRALVNITSATSRQSGKAFLTIQPYIENSGSHSTRYARQKMYLPLNGLCKSIKRSKCS